MAHDKCVMSDNVYSVYSSAGVAFPSRAHGSRKLTSQGFKYSPAVEKMATRFWNPRLDYIL